MIGAEILAKGLATERQPFEPSDETYAPFTHILHAEALLPPGLPAGTRQIGLWLPDACESLRLRPDYAIRTANRDTPWTEVAGHGCNRLGTVETR
jgi:hypothetical protein